MRTILGSSKACFYAVIFASALLGAAAGQESPEAPAGPDNIFYSAYRAADPLTRWPSNRLRRQFPELGGLKPTTSQSELPVILKLAGESVQRFLKNFTNTTSQETIDETRSGSLAGARSVDLVPGIRETVEQSRSGAPGEVHVREQFRYLMIQSRESVIEEYRTDLKGGGQDYDRLPSDVIRTTGFASLAVCFSSEQQSVTDFRYLGTQDVHHHRMDVIAFAQHAEPAAVIGRFRLFGPAVPILLQGIAWLDPADGQIVQIRTELLAPQPSVKLNRVATRVVFAKTNLLQGSVSLWLPKEVEVHIEAFAQHYLNHHRYTDYQIFTVQHRVLAVPPSASSPP